MLTATRFPRVTPAFVRRFHAEPSLFLGRHTNAAYAVHARHLSIRAVFRGHFVYRLGNREHVITAGEMLVINRDTPYGSYFHGPGKTETLSVFFGPTPGALAPAGGWRYNEIAMPIDGTLGEWLRTLRLILQRGDGGQLDAGTLARGLRAMGNEKGLVVPPCPVRRARHILATRFMEHWTLEALSREVGISRFHLVRRFRRECGMPPIRFLAWCRARYASELLAGSELTASRVAVEAGFGSRASLYRALCQFRANQLSHDPGAPPPNGLDAVIAAGD